MAITEGVSTRWELSDNGNEREWMNTINHTALILEDTVR